MALGDITNQQGRTPPPPFFSNPEPGAQGGGKRRRAGATPGGAAAATPSLLAPRFAGLQAGERLELANELRCGVCLGTLKSPCTTPCSHNFCRGCLAGVLKARPAEAAVPCPACRHPLPGGLELHVNSALWRVISILGGPEMEAAKSPQWPTPAPLAPLPSPASEFADTSAAFMLRAAALAPEAGPGAHEVRQVMAATGRPVPAGVLADFPLPPGGAGGGGVGVGFPGFQSAAAVLHQHRQHQRRASPPPGDPDTAMLSQ